MDKKKILVITVLIVALVAVASLYFIRLNKLKGTDTVKHNAVLKKIEEIKTNIAFNNVMRTYEEKRKQLGQPAADKYLYDYALYLIA
jgi:uncharacterized protein YxeA